MSFIEEIKNRAKQQIKTIILPEATDIRILKAAQIINKEKYAKVALIGNKEEIERLIKENNLELGDTQIIDPAESDKTSEYAKELYELRKAKGMTEEQAQKLILEPIYYGMMMVKLNHADGLVSGAAHSTADTLRPALQILKTAPGTKLVSAFFVMVVPNCEYGANGTFIFADSGLNEEPDADKLSEIAISSSKSFKQLVGEEPKVAMLSYSTYAKEKAPELLIDGELQLDAAIIPEVAEFKAKGSPLKGEANVLVFPDLGAGNIGYKLTQRLAKAEAYGPLCQGIARPVNDLSRGCSSEDVAGVVAITAVQAQSQG